MKDRPAERPDADHRVIFAGEVIASNNGLILETLLGSCIAVCLWDPIAGVGGMNHFILPDSTDSSKAPANFGVHAIRLLIDQCISLGGNRSRLEAKVFGGGQMLACIASEGSVSQRNVQFVHEFLAAEHIPVVSKDVAGVCARRISFDTRSGKIIVRRLSTGRFTDLATLDGNLQNRDRRRAA